MVSALLYLAAMLAAGLSTSQAGPSDGGRLSVAVAEPDIDSIVQAVGGDQVSSFSLFKECILKNRLQVEPDAVHRLAKADAVVWTGYLKESAAIHAALSRFRPELPDISGRIEWINVSKGATRVNVPTTTCYGYIDAGIAPGDPFFWLNPRNGSVIARNIAEGLGNLRPDKRDYFRANAEEFTKSLALDINRWKQQLSPIAGLRIFATLCGWQNFTRLGGPRFIVCKKGPGSLPAPERLIDQLRRMRAQIVVMDPDTQPEYERAFREEPGFRVAKVPSSIGRIPGATTYSQVFETMVESLLKSAEEALQSAKK